MFERTRKFLFGHSRTQVYDAMLDEFQSVAAAPIEQFRSHHHQPPKFGGNLREKVAIMQSIFSAQPASLRDYIILLYAERPHSSRAAFYVNIGKPDLIVLDRDAMTAMVYAADFKAKEPLIVHGFVVLNGEGYAVAGWGDGVTRFRGGPQNLQVGDTLHGQVRLGFDEDLFR